MSILNGLNNVVPDSLGRDKVMAEFIFSSLDLTSLNEEDTEDTIIDLSKKAISPLGKVAALCVYPRFVFLAKKQLMDTGISLATVANFPSGNESLSQILDTVNQAIEEGANEIDLVLPYKHYIAGDRLFCHEIVSAVRKVCSQKILKIILETGAFDSMEILASASKDCLDWGADFLKTSTGKISKGASKEAVNIFLKAIKMYEKQIKKDEKSNPVKGIKISGGVRRYEEAVLYINQVKEIMGHTFLNPKTFRIGASSLVQDLLNKGEVPLKNLY